MNNLPKIKFIKQPESFGSRIIGEIYQQMTPFEWHEHDWNCVGDIYEERVAKFEKITNVNLHSPKYFCLTEHDFLDLKKFSSIEYVKEQEKSSLENQIIAAGRRMQESTSYQNLPAKADLGRKTGKEPSI